MSDGIIHISLSQLTALYPDIPIPETHGSADIIQRNGQLAVTWTSDGYTVYWNFALKKWYPLL